MVISLTAPWFGREVLGWVVDMSSIGAAIGYGYTCLSSFRTLQANPQDHKPVLKVLSLVGAFFAVVFVGLLLIPGMPSYLAPESRICLLIWCVLGIIFYLKTNRKTDANGKSHADKPDAGEKNDAGEKAV